MDKVAQDLNSGRLGTSSPVVHLHTGDLVNTAVLTEDRLANTWRARLTDAPWALAVGNHDFWDNTRTPDQAARALGWPAGNHALDLGAVRLLTVVPAGFYSSSGTDAWVLPPATLTWLDGQLGADSRPTFIACHVPLQEQFGVYRRGYVTEPGPAIIQLLDAHPNAVAWLSGHIHTRFDQPRMFLTTTLPSGRPFVCVNTSATGAYTSAGASTWRFDPIWSVYLHYFGDLLEVRVRDHGAGRWGYRRVAKVATLRLASSPVARS
jgi:hypothetical protein